MHKLWRVLIDEETVSELKAIDFSEDESFIISSWIRFVEKYGPYKLSDFNIIDIRDHSLTRQRKWSGHRSSSFSKRGRIIYKIFDEK